MSLNHIVQYYKAHSEERQKELNDCILNNENIQGIKSIHILVEKDAMEEFKKIKIKNTNKFIINHTNCGQLLYSDLFHYCNVFLNNEVCMITHSDTILISGFEKISYPELRSVDGIHNRFYAVSRHELNCEKMDCKGCCTNANQVTLSENKKLNQAFCLTGDGMDAFIFATPVSEVIISRTKFQQNHWTCENALIWLFNSFDYLVLNPVWIVIKHNHQGTGWSNTQRGSIVNEEDIFEGQKLLGKCKRAW